MGAYIIRRLIQAAFVLLIVSILIFSMMRFLPGDPLQLYIAQSQLELISEDDLNILRTEFGLDKPPHIQYIDWLTDVLRGDFGTSIFSGAEVNKLIFKSLAITAYLAILSIVISTVLGIAAGIISALRRGGILDTLVTAVANFGISVPIFWLGILLILLLGLQLDLLPTHGYTSPLKDFWMSIKQLIMPVLCLSVFSLSSTTRQTRSSVLEVVRQDYIRTAWSKGLRERQVVLRHILKNSLIPVVTLLGLQLTHILGGSVFIETVFNIPGMGRLMVSSLFSQDYPIVQAGTLVIAGIVVVINLLVDISYGWLDPKVRYS